MSAKRTKGGENDLAASLLAVFVLGSPDACLNYDFAISRDPVHQDRLLISGKDAILVGEMILSTLKDTTHG